MLFRVLLLFQLERIRTIISHLDVFNKKNQTNQKYFVGRNIFFSSSMLTSANNVKCISEMENGKGVGWITHKATWLIHGFCIYIRPSKKTSFFLNVCPNSIPNKLRFKAI